MIYQRIKDMLSGVLMLLLGIAVFFVPEDGYYIIAIVIGALLIIYGLWLLWFYFTMARFMVGGRSCLTQAILALDLGLFTFMIARMSSIVVMFYLLAVYAVSGVIDILRAMEIKKNEGPGWKPKLISGAIVLLSALVLVLLSIIMGQNDYLVYGFCIGLLYSAVYRIIAAFRRTTPVFIQ